MRSALIVTATLSLLPLTACASDGGLFSQSPSDRRYESREDRRDVRRETRRNAARDYREDARYRERNLGRNDRIYRGDDGRYYCDRDDGTTGLIVGALGGGVLGNVIAPGGSNTIGTLLGAGAGALIGRAIDQGEAKCR